MPLPMEENAWFNYQRSLPVKTPIPHVRGEISCSLKETFSVSVTTHKSQIIIPKLSFRRISSKCQCLFIYIVGNERSSLCTVDPSFGPNLLFLQTYFKFLI